MLLDTHVFLWALSAPERLSAEAFEAISDPASEVFISSAVVWEIVIKHALGKLNLPSDPTIYIPARIAQLGFRHLPISHEHALTVAVLPKHQADAFERMLVAQARFEGMTLVSCDPNVGRYGVRFLVAG